MSKMNHHVRSRVLLWTLLTLLLVGLAGAAFMYVLMSARQDVVSLSESNTNRTYDAWGIHVRYPSEFQGAMETAVDDRQTLVVAAFDDQGRYEMRITRSSPQELFAYRETNPLLEPMPHTYALQAFSLCGDTGCDYFLTFAEGVFHVVARSWGDTDFTNVTNEIIENIRS